MRSNLGASWRGSLALALALGVAACGSDDDDGGSGPSATISGNLISAPTAAVARVEKSLLARIAEEMTTFVREAYAQVAGVEGVEVSAGERAVVTGADGRFDLSDVPAGDVALRFRRGTCEAAILVPAVADGATVLLEDVDFTCESAAPARVTEMMEAVVVQKPASANGNITVCVETAGATADRAVQVRDATFSGGTFDELAEGERVELTGTRRGASDESAFDAEVVNFLGPVEGDDDLCLARLNGEPTPAGTPEPTPDNGGGTGGTDGAGGTGGTGGTGGAAGTGGTGGTGGTDGTDGTGGTGGMDGTGGTGGTDGAGGTGGTDGTDGTGGTGGMDGTGGTGGTDGTGGTGGTDGTGGTGGTDGAGGTGGTTDPGTTGINDPAGTGFGDVIGAQSTSPGGTSASDPNAPADSTGMGATDSTSGTGTDATGSGTDSTSGAGTDATGATGDTGGTISSLPLL